LTDSSGDFIRVLRYPGTEVEATIDPLRFPAHRDAVSIAILFTWLGGLQIVDGEAANATNPFAVPDAAWRWIKPVPGTAVVNLGDAMEVFTNKLLKSGLHRVIKAPGGQRAHDKYSVLIVARPEDNTPMRGFTSPVIPAATEEQKNAPVYSSIEWGHNKIKALQDFIDKLQSARAGKTENLERSW
jgi:isopenicillin N synthase-like dioxygenase